MLEYMAKGIKVAKQLTLRYRDYPGLSRGTERIHKNPCKWKQAGSENQLDGSDIIRRSQSTLLALKMEE